MIVEFEGQEYEVPDDTTDDELNEFLNPQPEQPKVEPGLYRDGEKIIMVNEDGTHAEVSQAVAWAN